MRTTTQRKHDRRTKHEPQNLRSAGTGDQSKTTKMGEKAEERRAEEEMNRIRHFLLHPPRRIEKILEKSKLYRAWVIREACALLHDRLRGLDNE